MPNRGFYGFSTPRQNTVNNIFSGDLTSSGTYTSSTNYGTSPASKAFDDLWSSDAQAWMTNGVNTNSWVQVQLANAHIVTKINVRTGAPQSANRAAKHVRLDGSNDGVNYTKISAIGWAGGAGAYNTDETTLTNDTGTIIQTIFFMNSTFYTYYRLYCYDNYGDGYLAIAEIEMFELMTAVITLME